MVVIPAQAIEAYRAETFRLSPGKRLRDIEDAIEYVNERGYVFFWPIRGIEFPSLWTATAGNRPVADAHDDPGHVTWGWKDGLLGKRRWYYAKVLRRKSTMISMEIAPFFYALSENYGAPEEDYLTLYEQGRMTMDAKRVYEMLLTEGPLDTVSLRRALHMSSVQSENRFNRALVDLQVDFKICPIGIAQTGAWRYSFIYEVTARHLPALVEQAEHIQESEARRCLVECAVRSLGALQIEDLSKLLGWKGETVQRVVNDFVERGFIKRGLRMENSQGEWLALNKFV
mgnify:CR=1 FL=1